MECGVLFFSPLVLKALQSQMTFAVIVVDRDVIFEHFLLSDKVRFSIMHLKKYSTLSLHETVFQLFPTGLGMQFIPAAPLHLSFRGSSLSVKAIRPANVSRDRERADENAHQMMKTERENNK